MDPDVIMVWAACCVGFFGYLQAGEMTVPSDKEFDPSVHLSFCDIAVDNHMDP